MSKLSYGLCAKTQLAGGVGASRDQGTRRDNRPSSSAGAACHRQGRSDASRDRAVSGCDVSGRRAVKQHLHLHQEQSFRPLTRPGYFLLLAQKKANQRKGLPCKGTSPRDRSRRRDAPDRPSMACLRTARLPAGRPTGLLLTGKATKRSRSKSR